MENKNDEPPQQKSENLTLKKNKDKYLLYI